MTLVCRYNGPGAPCKGEVFQSRCIGTSLPRAIGIKAVATGKPSRRHWQSRYIGTGAWETSGGVWPPCELAGRNDMNIVEIVRCSRRTLLRFCGVWYCDSLQCRKKTKIRSPAKHNVFAVLLTPLQGESQRTGNPAINGPFIIFFPTPVQSAPTPLPPTLLIVVGSSFTSRF